MKYERGRGYQIRGLYDMYMATFGYKEDGYFIEVGAFNCWNWSNTYGLAAAGWHGLYYEPQVDRANECAERWEDYKNISIHKLALSDEPGTAPFYLGGSLSTLDLEQRDVYRDEIPWGKSSHSEEEIVDVTVSTLNIELEKHNWPIGFEVLVIDVEGSEQRVLQSFDIALWQPLICIVETHENSQYESLSRKAEGINAYFADADYEKIYTDHINSVYVKEVHHDCDSKERLAPH